MASATTARTVALQALVDLDRSAGRANVVLPAVLDASALAPRDRGFVTELVYGTLRMQRACDWLVDRHLRRPIDPPVRAALRLGTYQLAFLGTPAHAAVSETVAEVHGPARGLVNAVLRRVALDMDSGLTWPEPAVELSYPDWILAEMSAALGSGVAFDALHQMNESAIMTIRGDGYVQDLASQWAAAAVGAGPNERIADLCAAPGGKATYLAYGPAGPAGRGPDGGPVDGVTYGPAGAAGDGPDGGPDGGPVDGVTGGGDGGPGGGPGTAAARAARPAMVVAGDVDPKRATVVAANASRLGLANVATLVADATHAPFRPGTFDRVLVDAPCSGLGVLRRRPDARWRVSPSDVERLVILQRRLLEAALVIVRPGGRVVYSVCTLTRAETSGIDDWLAETHPEARAIQPDLGPAWQPCGRGALLLPQAAGTDGMFLLALQLPDRQQPIAS